MPAERFMGTTRRALVSGFRSALPEGTQYAELIFRLEDRSLSVRGFAAYLRLLDSAYGRASESGFRSYALRDYEHLRINSIQRGSIELQFMIDLFHDLQVLQLGTVYILAKILPAIVKGEAFKNWAEGFKAAGEARAYWQRNPDQKDFPQTSPEVVRKELPQQFDDERSLLPDVQSTHAAMVPYSTQPLVQLTKKQRKLIREEIKRDPMLDHLSSRQIGQLIDLIGDILAYDARSLVQAARFSRESVQEIIIRARKDAG
jgi:hypothetical protein